MRAIVLAAGRGSRISEEIDAIPKSLLKVNGKTILETLLDQLDSLDISASVCVGYRHKMVEKVLSNRQVTFYYNPFYRIMNNVGTIWFAREEFEKGDDLLILSADLVFDIGILERLCDADSELAMAVDSSRVLEGDYFFHLNHRGEILAYGPDVPEQERDCEYMGISMVRKKACAAFCGRLDEMMEAEEFNRYFENVFFSFRDDSDIRLRAVDVAGLPWREIDIYEDYQKALKQFQ